MPEIRNADAGLAPTPTNAARASTGDPRSGPSTASDSEALVELLAQVDAIRELDEASKAQLLEDLKQTDPSLWPAMIQQFRAALAYRRQLEQRERFVSESPPGTEPVDHTTALRSVAEPADGEPARTAVATGNVTPTATQASHAAASPPASDDAVREAGPRAANETMGGPPPNNRLAPEPRGDRAGVSPSRTTTRRPEPLATTHRRSDERKAEPPDDVDDVDIVAASHGEPPDWRAHLQRAITELERENRDVPRHTEEVGRHAALRMLYLAAGRRKDAMRAIDGIPPAQQDFWSRQLYGLAAYLDDDDHQDAGRRATTACRHLQEAVDKLGEMATLEVRNLEFCTEVSSFGVFKAFENKEFVAGQEVLLYAEIGNFRSVPTEKGYCTALRTSYEILDARGLRVDQHEFATTEDYCQNRRRDFFMRYFIRLPERIYEGRYTLQLTIEDVRGHKIGQSSIEFQIKDA